MTAAVPTTEPRSGATGRDAVVAGAVSWLADRLRWFDPEQWARHLRPKGFAPSALLELLIICRNLTAGHRGSPSVMHQDGSAGRRDGSATQQDGPAARRDGPAGQSDGSAARRDGSAGWRDGSAGWRDGSAAQRDGSAGRQDGSAGCALRSAGAAGPAIDLAGRALDLAEEVVRRPGFGAGLHRGDAGFPHHVWLIALLAEAGRPVDPWPGVAQRLIDAGCAEPLGPGRSAAARLEAGYVFELAGLRHGLPRMAELAADTALGPGADPLLLTDADLYVITHMIFYLTDFGRRPLSPGGDVARIRGLVEVLLGRQLAVGDLDLGAELLACAGITGADPRLVACAWERLAAARRPDGSVPSPLFRQEALDRLSGEQAEAYEFGTCYHTTLATVLAATLTDGAHE